MDKKIIPSHVGIIMDGNGRWATIRGKSRSFGHKKGSKNVDKIVEHAFKSGVKTLTLYAFSAENWARPKKEVDTLMSLLKDYFKTFKNKVISHGVKLRVIGGRKELSKELIEVIEQCERESAHNTEHNLNIAINYGARQEIVRVVNVLIDKGEPITEQSILSSLDTSECGEVDLIIRTGGELRLSNFLLYQGAYSELFFSNLLWPDFNEDEFDRAIESFSNRNRRFGKV